MNNRLSYCGLIDAKIRASDKNLPLKKQMKNLKAALPKIVTVRKYLMKLEFFAMMQENLKAMKMQKC